MARSILTHFADRLRSRRSPPMGEVAAAKAAGAPTINYGAFINIVLEFIVVALAVFLIVKASNRMKAAQAPTTKDCPHCLTKIPAAATKCPACTSEL